MANVSILDVLLYGEPVGTLTHVGGDRTLFAFNENYITAKDRPVLSLGFKDHLGGLITDFSTTQTRLLPFFSNLLPEGHMRTYLAQRAGGESRPRVLPALGPRYGPAGGDHHQTRRR